MRSSVWIKALAAWFLLLSLAILNGGLREHLLVPALGRMVALPVSGVLLSAAIFLVTWLVSTWFRCRRAAQYWLIGVLWLVLTLLFEFGLGRFVQHRDWLDLLGAYTFRGGNLWPLVLVVTLVSPRLAARLRGLG